MILMKLTGIGGVDEYGEENSFGTPILLTFVVNPVWTLKKRLKSHLFATYEL